MKENDYKKQLFANNCFHILKIMRIILFLIFLSTSTVFPNVFSQNNIFSFNFSNNTVKSILLEIENESDYAFLFADDLTKEMDQKVSTTVESSTINYVLDMVFRSTNLSYQIIDRQILITRKSKNTTLSSGLPSNTQQRTTIRGKIMDNKGEPLPGATVYIKAKPTLGVTTDLNGEFTFQVPDLNQLLVISFIGMETQIVNLKPNVLFYNVKLNIISTELTEIVATGYFQRKKDNFTGTTLTVSGEELKKINPGNIFQSIEAFDPSFKITTNNLLGSNPNSLPNINIRGVASVPTGGSGEVLRRDNLSATVNMPTYILDGYEVGVEKIFDLDLNRVASITLLKDAAATAIYGSRASNGVLVITTIEPEEGKLRVGYNFELNLNVPDLSSYKVLNASQKLEYERLAGLYDYIGASSQNELDELYYQKMYNVVSGVDTYWLSQPVENAYGFKHSLYLDGGSQNIRYGINLQYQSAPGVMRGSGRDRYGIGAELSYNLSKKILFKNVLSVTKVDATESPYGSFSDYVRMNPYYPMTDEKGNLIRKIDSWTDRSGTGGSLNTEVVLNPLYNGTLSSFNKSNYLEVNDAFSAEWNITDQLRVRGLISLNQKKSENDNFLSPLSNDYYFYSSADLAKRGRYFYQSTTESTVDGNITMTYSKGIHDHFINMALGTNIRENTYNSKWLTAIGFTNDRFSNIGFANGYQENTAPGSSSNIERLFGSFFSLNYSFKNKYLLDLSLRADGSSKFGTDNKVATFWAAGIGWNMHNEDFAKSWEAISMLKLKANTGLTGSVSFLPYMSNTLYDYYKTSWYSTGVGAIVNQYGNESLKWQRTRNYDIGLDLGLLKDRLYFTGRYYYKLTKDMLTDITLPPSTGFSYYKENLGDMKNVGYEIGTKLNVFKNKDWSVMLNGNFIHNSNKLVKISNSLKELNNKADEAQTNDDYKGVPLLRYNEGQSLNTIYAIRSLGIDPENGKEIFIKKDGTLTNKWDVKDIVPICDATPTLEGYFGGSVYYKGFMINCSLYTRFGGYEYNQTLVDRVENADPRYNVDERVLNDRWKQPGDVALYKDIADLGTTYVSDRFIEKDNTLEIRSIYLSYDFGKDILEKLHMRNLRTAITLNNLWRSSSIAIERGIDYPFARSFTLSFQANF